MAAEWLRTNEATVALQTSCKTMTRRIKDVRFVLGDHFVQIGPHKTSTRIWSIEHCRETQVRWDGPSPTCWVAEKQEKSPARTYSLEPKIPYPLCRIP